MPQPLLGKIEIVNPRELWKNEERDFTPWIAENIEELSKLLGVQIVVDHTERRVGGYELDILGHIGERDVVVIIENQLTCTDHGHMGQLITYAAGLKASVVIWIASEVRDEHKTAIEWLNDLAGSRASFFLVRPEVKRIGKSLPAIEFRVESAPSEFERRFSEIVETEEGPRHEFRRNFWAGLFQYLANNGHPWAKGRSTTKTNWISSAVGKSGVYVNVSMAQGSRIRVEIYLPQDADKQLFEKLLGHKSEIEGKFVGDKISWERLDDDAASRVAVYRPYQKEEVKEESTPRRELYEWINKNLTAFRLVAKEFLVDR